MDTSTVIAATSLVATGGVGIAWFRVAQRRRFEALAMPLIDNASQRITVGRALIERSNGQFDGNLEIADQRLPMPYWAYPEAAVRPPRQRRPRRSTRRRR
jgi:hypothetical protein